MFEINRRDNSKTVGDFQFCRNNSTVYLISQIHTPKKNYEAFLLS